MNKLSEEEIQSRNEIAWRIELTRVMQGISIADLSIWSGIPLKSVETMRKAYDKRLGVQFTDERLEAIGKALNVSPIWLKTGLAKDLDVQTARTLKIQALLGVER